MSFSIWLESIRGPSEHHRRRTRHLSPAGRLLRCEQLEQRRLLATFDSFEVLYQVGSTENDHLNDLAIAPDGSVWGAGQTFGEMPGEQKAWQPDAVVFGLNPDGSQRILDQFGTFQIDDARGVAANSSRVGVVGFTGGSLDGQASLGDYDYFLRLYDPTTGNLVQTIQDGSPFSDQAFAVTADEEAFYVHGTTRGDLHGNTNLGSSDVFVAKYLNDGTRQWTTTLGTPLEDEAGDITLFNPLAIAWMTLGVVPGASNVDGDKDTVVTTIERDNGIIMWQVQDDDHVGELDVVGVAPDDFGNFYVVGNRINGATSLDTFTTAVNPDGIHLWTSTQDLSGDQVAEDIEFNTIDNVLLIVGGTNTSLPGQGTIAGGDDLMVSAVNTGDGSFNESQSWQDGTDEDDVAFAIEFDYYDSKFWMGGRTGGSSSGSNRGNDDVIVGATSEPAGGQFVDFGDAPSPYPTLLEDNGARHSIELDPTPSVFLGGQLDTEDDGAPDESAEGDDDITLDDEDGVVFISEPLRAGETESVQVTAYDSGFLSAWIDFNVDGDWADPGEQIFESEPLDAFENTLEFAVPPFSGYGSTETFARFRLSPNNEALSFDGPAVGGEVEDYRVFIYFNQPPVANDDEATTDEGTPVTVAPMSNDSDPEGDPLRIANVAATSVERGSVTDNGDGTFTYYPPPDYNGPDSVYYVITDDRGGYAGATVTFTVNKQQGVLWLPGDADDDGDVDISDAIFQLKYLFLGGESPPCLDANDVNGDGNVDLGDTVHLVSHLFLGGPQPVQGIEPVLFNCSDSCESLGTSSRIASAEALRIDGKGDNTLNGGQANSLLVKLKNAQRQLDRGNEKAATNMVRAFVNEATALISAGVVPATPPIPAAADFEPALAAPWDANNGRRDGAVAAIDQARMQPTIAPLNSKRDRASDTVLRYYSHAIVDEIYGRSPLEDLLEMPMADDDIGAIFGESNFSLKEFDWKMTQHQE